MERFAESIVAARPAASGWRAELKLRYERVGDRTVLAERRHQGPLVVQKTLYPEDDAVCQAIVVHPPAGIVGGDELAICADVGANAHAQLTTPGAAKWYRSAAELARQELELRVASGGVLEWLPQEAIVFDGALADLDTTIELAGDAVFIGWDLVCLGRAASGETFARGRFRQRLELARNGTPAFVERVVLAGDTAFLGSPVGLNGAAVFGTFLAGAETVPDVALAACRELSPAAGEGAVTRMRDCLVARYRGASAETARAYFVELWRCVRPVLIGREAVPPRIWNT
jgi:urease accessory protein